MSKVSLTNLKISETTILQRLLQLYYFESTVWSKEEICSDGLYDGCTASDLEVYVDSANDKAYLIKVGETLAGFVLLEKITLEENPIWELADFFILPKYRGGWIALDAVRQIFALVGQPMAVSTFKENKLALRFFNAVAKRVQLESVRELTGDDKSPFYTFIVNELTPDNPHHAGAAAVARSAVRGEELGNTMNIRRYTSSDWHRVCEIHDAARRDELAAAGLSDAYLTLAQTADNEGFDEYEIRVAERDGKVLGFVAFTTEELAWLYVDPLFYGKGIGTALIQAALRETAAPLSAEVLDGNTAAIAVYKKQGFVEMGRSQGRMPGNESFAVSVTELRHPGFV